MNIRPIQPRDIDKLRIIYEKNYETFEFPNFCNFMYTFVVCDDQDNIISGGGIRLIPEAVLATDKSYSVKDRRIALFHSLDACEFIAKSEKFNRLYAVTKDIKWCRHLEKAGFHSRGNMLVLDL